MDAERTYVHALSWSPQIKVKDGKEGRSGNGGSASGGIAHV